MKRLLMVAVVLAAFAPDAMCQPTYQWHTFYGSAFDGALGTDRAYAIAYDASGNTYTTGMSESTWNGPSGQTALHAHSGPTNVFVLKLDSNGAYQWHTFFGGDGDRGDDDYDCYGFDITIDANGSIYVTGFSNATWNGPTGQDPRNAHTGSGRDFFVMKLDSAGLYKWHTFYGCADSDEGSGIICDAGNNVYAAGFSEGTWNGPSGNSPINAYGGEKDIFVLKLNSSGAYKWHTFFGNAADNDEAFIIDSDAGSGGIVIGGYSNLTWNGPGDQSPRHSHSGGREIAIVKLNSSGAYQWHTFYGSSESDEVRGIRIDRQGNVCACGNSSGTWQGDGGADPLHAYSGSADHMILKLASSGAYLWHTFYGSDSEKDYANDLALDTNDDLYIAGRGYADWQGDGGTDPLHAFSGYRDIAVMKLSSTGAYEWHTFYGSDSGDDRGQDVVLDKESLYVAGRCSQSWTGDTPGDTPLNDFSGGPGDAFVLKFNVPVKTVIIPSLNEWGVVGLIGLLAIVGCILAQGVRRHRKPTVT